MSTPFEEIYTRFGRDIDDYELGLISDEELNDVLFGFLESGIDEFPECRKDLSIIYIDNEPHFQSDLSSKEKSILSMCMRKIWLNSKLYNADNMERHIGDRDYRAIQGTGYIDRLSALDDKLQDEIRTYSVGYTYENFSLEGW